MKRILVEPRKNITKACIFCKARKRKCDGLRPCSFCRLKNKEHECNYDFVDKRSIRYMKSRSKVSLSKHSLSSNSSSTASLPHVSLLSEIREHHYGAPQLPDQEKSTRQTNEQPPMPEHDRNARFVGESSPLTLLNQTRHILQNLNVSSLFAIDNSPNPELHMFHLSPLNLSNCEFVKNQAAFDLLDPPPFVLQDVDHIQLPDRQTAMSLIQLFSKNFNQIMYLFDDNFLEFEVIDILYNRGIHDNHYVSCQFYLILSVTILYLKASDTSLIADNSEEYFNYAMKILNFISEDASLSLIQVYMMIFLHNLFTNRRNTAWLNLGHAIRISQSLGLNRKKANTSFKHKEMTLHRRKLWRTLYIFDRTFSINLGRPLSIDDKIWDDMNNLPIENGNNLRSVCQNELMKLNKLNGEIYEKIYYNGKVSVQTVYKLAVDLNIWSNNLPRQLRVEELLELDASTVADQYIYHSLFFLHLIQLNGIILLTRPFFHFQLVRILNSLVRNLKDPNSNIVVDELLISSELTRIFTKSCLNSSIFTIRLCWFCMKNKIYSVYSFTLINNVLDASLIIGLDLLLDVIKVLEAKVKIHHELLEERIKNYETHIKILKISLIIFENYSIVSIFAEKYYKAINDLKESLESMFNSILKLSNHENRLFQNDLNINEVFNKEEIEQINRTKIELKSLESLRLDDLLNNNINMCPSLSKTGENTDNSDGIAWERSKTIDDLEMLSAFMFDWEDIAFLL